jgi:hypothetical protein
MAVCKSLQTQEPDFYRDGIFKLVPKWDKCIIVPRDYVENNYTLVEQMYYI